MIPNQAPISPLENLAPTIIINKSAPIATNTAVIFGVRTFTHCYIITTN
jgi:hypothetical protein